MSSSRRINTNILVTWLGFQYPTLHLSSENSSETLSISACLSPGRILVYQHDHLLTLFAFKYDNYLWVPESSHFAFVFAFDGSQLQSCYQPTPWSSRSSEADTNKFHGAESFLRNWYQPVPWNRVVVEKLIVAANEAFPSLWESKFPLSKVRSLHICSLLACVPFSVERSLCVCVCFGHIRTEIKMTWQVLVWT
jgi:hypothetical protein